jgi:beta-lactamase class A
MTSAELAAALILAINGQHFDQTADSRLAGLPVRHFPSIDVAVIAFPERGEPVAANVLFSRNQQGGLIADIAPKFGQVRNISYLADQRDANGESIAWAPDADWSTLQWQALAGDGPQRFVAPYPASLIKLMVLVGVAREIDRKRTEWDASWSYAGQQHSVREWSDAMIVVSSNEATSALVALLHHTGAIQRSAAGETRNDVNDSFARYGLSSLRLSNTKADGGWTNPAGAGVGQLQMTAWDSARLLWLLDDQAPAAPWLETSQPALLSAAARREVRGLLEAQALHEVLSSTALAGVKNWQPGIPAQLPARWIRDDGSAVTPEHKFPADVRPANTAAQVRFAHKTGTTENYVADAGIVSGISPAKRHYIVALIASLGTRYAPDETCATTWRIPSLGAAIDNWLAQRLEAKP